MRINAKITIKQDRLERAIKKAQDILEQSFNDCMDDLVRVSGETAPHDKGVLEKSSAKTVSRIGNRMVGKVSYSVREGSSSGRYNYALAMHEKSYKLGKGSLSKPGGRGMSGKFYRVGNKFLTRPLEGEKKAYMEHIQKEVGKQYKT